MDLLEQASTWLEEQRSAFATRSISYERGTDLAIVPATVGRTVFRTDDSYGAQIRTETRDYLILAADLVLPGIGPTLPQRGDRIRETAGTGRPLVYEVMAPGDEPVWRYSDPYCKTLRIHTKQVEEEAAP